MSILPTKVAVFPAFAYLKRIVNINLENIVVIPVIKFNTIKKLLKLS